MSTQDDVRRIALSLPATSELEGELAFRVGGEKFVWTWRQRVHPRKPKVPNPEVIVLPVEDPAEKEALLRAGPEAFFTTEHYAGHNAVLVRLLMIDNQELTELITDSWHLRAPTAILGELGRQ